MKLLWCKQPCGAQVQICSSRENSVLRLQCTYTWIRVWRTIESAVVQGWTEARNHGARPGQVGRVAIRPVHLTVLVSPQKDVFMKLDGASVRCWVVCLDRLSRDDMQNIVKIRIYRMFYLMFRQTDSRWYSWVDKTNNWSALHIFEESPACFIFWLTLEVTAGSQLSEWNQNSVLCNRRVSASYEHWTVRNRGTIVIKTKYK